MDNNSFINLETFEITDSIPNYIIVDSLIANTIAILNKKGYKTLSSCSGHFYQHTKTLQEEVDIELLEDAKNNLIYTVDEIREKDFDCWLNHCSTSIYVMFDKDYEFSNIPEGFELEKNNIVRCTIELFENNKRKEQNKIIKEIEKYNEILKYWAKKLPNIN